jgi:hypothetical protein
MFTNLEVDLQTAIVINQHKFESFTNFMKSKGYKISQLNVD